MSTDPFLFDLEVRGYVPFPLTAELAKHVTTAVSRSGSFSTPHDLVLVVDRTQADGLLGSAAAPHRTSRRAGPFSMPHDELVALAKSLPCTAVAPLARVMILEISDVPPSREDLDRLDTYTTPAGGNVLLGAAYVNANANAPAVHTNDGGSPYSTGLVHADDIADIARKAYGAPRLDGPSTDPVALFTSRTVGALSFVCSPIAGAALLGWNFHKTRRTRIGLTIAGGTMLTFIVASFASMLAGDAGYALTIPLNIGGAIVFVGLNRAQFGEPLRKGNIGFAIVIAAGVLLFFVVTISALAFVTNTRVE